MRFNTTKEGIRLPEFETWEEVEAGVDSDDPYVIGASILNLADDHGDFERPMQLVRRFAEHPNAYVRTACAVAISMIVSLHRRIDSEVAARFLERALTDENEYVSSNAFNALSDLHAMATGFPPPGYEHLLDYLQDDGE